MDWLTVVKILGAAGGWAGVVALAGLVWGYKARLRAATETRDRLSTEIDEKCKALAKAEARLVESELVYRKAAQDVAVRHAEEMSTVRESRTVLEEVLRESVTADVAAAALERASRLSQARRRRENG